MSEIDKISALIEAKTNFLLSGGAGSGKTYTLVKVIERIFEDTPKANVACITYTNVAVRQINDRVRYSNLRVSTIHDFLWDNIKGYQKSLKKSLVELITNKVISYSGEEAITEEYFDDKAIEYKEWKNIKEGIVTHDEILVLAEYMFQNNPLLSKILKDKYNFILIDEYQDTAPEVIRILLECLPAANGSNIIGFFGDSMQSIYQGTIGNISTYIESGLFAEVIKEDNRRNPPEIVELANKLRIDTVVQTIANDSNAPNFQKHGTIKFLYSQNNSDLESIKQTEYFKTWNFDNPDETKELYLTHNLIAPKAGFPSLMKIYDADKILDYKYDLSNRIKEGAIVISENATFGDVIQLLNIPPRGITKIFIDENPELYASAKEYQWSIFKKIYLDKDQLIGNKKGTAEEESKRGSKRDSLVRHLFHIQECIHLYQHRKYNEFIRHTGFKVQTAQSKVDLKIAIETLANMFENTIEEVIEYAHEQNIWLKDDTFNEFKIEKEYVYNRIKNIPYREFLNVYNYVEGYTPFSTQHNIKGAEFENVFVVLDNGRWNMYNFETMFTRGGSVNVCERTLKLFYVCCTRAKNNLVIYYFQPSQQVINAAQELFGAENIVEI